MKKIRVTETRIYEYAPDLEDVFYKDREVNTAEGAMEADKLHVKNGYIDVDELTENDPTVIVSWEVFDEV